MIRISNIKMPVDYTFEQLNKYICRVLKVSKTPKYNISRLSIDDRKRNEVKYILSVDVLMSDEKSIVNKLRNKDITVANPVTYKMPDYGQEEMLYKPVIVGLGPAGLFAGLHLSRAGFKPIIIERGMDAISRTKEVQAFWNGEKSLNPESNVQFGEGGAGTFSDGKLNTVIKDKFGRRTEVLRTLVEYGGNENILYLNKPHIGTDELTNIVINIRKEIERLGGCILFNTKFTDFELKSPNEAVIKVCGTNDNNTNVINEIKTNALILAIGHSARDTFEKLYEKGLTLSQKPFAMGLRIEHSQEFINNTKYGDKEIYKKYLPAADYKMTHTCENGRAVYSFCMCPGGYVVNASSEEGRLCVNGMSMSSRDGKNANSAIVVNITPEDFENDHPLAGMYLQQKYEKAAFDAGEGQVPVQLFGDYMKDIASSKIGNIVPQIKGSYKLTSLNSCLPEYAKNAIIEGVLSFDKRHPGYGDKDVILSGIEARTSSPIRIERDEELRCPDTPIYPCGEGAGYAGGITSAAVDGIKVAESIISRFKKYERD